MVSQENTGLEVAIIGMAGRFPGARNVRQLWDNLKNGVESITRFSDEELDDMGITPEVYKRSDYVRAKGRLDHAEWFDSDFFNYVDNEAAIMDPQIRLLHECSYEALEDAGYDSSCYKGLIGYYAGALPNHYWEHKAAYLSDQFSEQFDALHLIDKDFLSSRVSYKLDLRGPSVTVATACSTSLTSVHMACRALLMGECHIALAGGASLLFPSKAGYIYREGTIFSRDGKCRVFDANSTGTVPGEGLGIVVLKPLVKALHDRDTIYAVIKGSAINNDGAEKAGYTVPNINGPAQVIKRAIDFARIKPESISYVETHGTGTKIGDHIEFEALCKAFGTDKDNNCFIGSHKPNLGYLGPASGVTGLIKTVMALRYKLLPPTINCTTTNPDIDFQSRPFRINTQLVEWHRNGTPRRAGINNIAVGGTNAHVIIEEAPLQETSAMSREWKLITLSTKTKLALDASTDELASYFAQYPQLSIADAAFTLHVGRRTYPYRRAIICKEHADAVDSLTTLNQKYVKTDLTGYDGDKKTFFLFPGIISHLKECTIDLFKKELDYRSEVERLCELSRTHLGQNVQAFFIDPGYVTQDAQELGTLSFIIQYALARMLINWGVSPNGMIGYGTGEYIAAALSGLVSAEDALRMTVARIETIAKAGHIAQLKVKLSKKDIEPFINKQISVVAYLDQTSVIIGGDQKSIYNVKERFVDLGIRTGQVHGPLGLHSSLTDIESAQFNTCMTDVDLKTTTIPLLSNITGSMISDKEALSKEFWLSRIKEPMNISNSVEKLLQHEQAIFIEMGVGDCFLDLLSRHTSKNSSHTLVPLVRHPRENMTDSFFLIDKLAKLWCSGIRFEWDRFYCNEKRYRTSLPTYPFHQRDFGIGKIGAHDKRYGVSEQ